MRRNRWMGMISCLACMMIACAAWPRLALAQTPGADDDPPDPAQSAAAADAQRHVEDAIQAVARMLAEPRLAALLDRAKGVLIVPRYAEGGFIVGGSGGVGVLLAHTHRTWTDPVFYRVGGVSIGLQLGGASGPIALLLMSEKAVQKFQDSLSTWSLGGRAGLTVARFSQQTSHPAGSLDVIVWSRVQGLFGGVAFSALDVTPDQTANHAYYRSPVAPLQILVGAVRNPRAQPLCDALATHVALN